MIIEKNEKRTGLTLLTNENYLYGVVGLYFSLQEVGTKYPFHCIVTSNVKQEAIDFLNNIGIHTIIEEPGYVSQEAYDQQVKDGKFKYQSVVSFHTKVKMYFYTQFDKIVFLDGDMMVFQNIDELFECKHLSYCLDNEVYYKKEYFHMNSGLLVYEPKKIPSELKDFIRDTTDGSQGDESVLINFFHMADHREQGLSPYYNIWWTKIDEGYRLDGTFNPDNIKVIHFVVGDKPWQKDADWIKNLSIEAEPEGRFGIIYLKKYVSFINTVIDYLELKGLSYPGFTKIE